MKKCNICNQLYADDFDQCPRCSKLASREIRKIVMSVLGIIIILLILFFSFLLLKEDPQIISVSQLGEKYPYTIDKVRIECAADYPQAIYIVDKNKNKYAINGNAHVYFSQIKPDKKYKGYTTTILKAGSTDIDILQTGLNFCKE